MVAEFVAQLSAATPFDDIPRQKQLKKGGCRLKILLIKHLPVASSHSITFFHGNHHLQLIREKGCSSISTTLLENEPAGQKKHKCSQLAIL